MARDHRQEERGPRPRNLRTKHTYSAGICRPEGGELLPGAASQRSCFHLATGICAEANKVLLRAEREHPLAIAFPSETTLERASAMATKGVSAVPPLGERFATKESVSGGRGTRALSR